MFGSFKYIIGKNTIPTAPPGYYYLFKSNQCASISGYNTAKLLNGKRVKYTEARDYHRLTDFSFYHQDSKFVGIGKYCSKYF